MMISSSQRDPRHSPLLLVELVSPFSGDFVWNELGDELDGNVRAGRACFAGVWICAAASGQSDFTAVEVGSTWQIFRARSSGRISVGTHDRDLSGVRGQQDPLPIVIDHEV
jgi:hypothetical protein